MTTEAARRTRLIALGDELMAGVGDPKALGWIGRAVARSSGSRAGAAVPIELYVDAVPSLTTAALAERWEEAVTCRIDAEAHAEGAISHKVAIGLGHQDVLDGVSLARTRLNLAKVVDGLERLRLGVFVVGPPPSRDRSLTTAIRSYSHALDDVCSRRGVPYVDTVGPLATHDQWLADVTQSPLDLPQQAGYGLLAWLVLHGGFGDFVAA